MIIADTCLLVHLFNETEMTSLAQKILKKDPNWIFPSIWKEEYANVLSKLIRKEQRPLKEVVEHFEFILVELQHNEIAVDILEALRICIEYKISVYDAHFIYLASKYNVSIITEDKEILKNCKNVSLSMVDFLNT